MSGHSKWSQIKRKKGLQDEKRGRAFTRIIKEITVAARLGGGDIAGNPRLRAAVDEAKAQNMPKENIERAIKRGTGELEGVTYEEIVYEGYGPGGVAVMVECVTDNKNRTVSDIRKVFSKHGGKLGESGSVSWMFDKRGVVVLEGNELDEDRLMEVAITLDAIDTRQNPSEETWEVHVDSSCLEEAKRALIEAGFRIESASIMGVPKTSVHLEGKDPLLMLKLMDALDELDDVQSTYANFDIDVEELQKYVA
jgi:YebC/PmpR family DNA-binding regulatory protein